MRIVQIQFGRCANMLAIPVAVGVEKYKDVTNYLFYFLFFYIGFIFEEKDDE